MNVAEKHIRHYNRLNGNEISKATLQAFHSDLKKDIDSKKIDAHMPLGVECIDMEKRIDAALKKINGHNVILECKLIDVSKVLALQSKFIPYKTKPKVNIEDNATLLHGLEEIPNDKDLDSKPLDGLNDTTYQVITDRILSLIKQDGLIWRKPWNSKVHGPSDLAHNYVTKNIYRGGNYYLNYIIQKYGGGSMLINGKKVVVNYEHAIYFTFKQVTELGGSVNKGEMGWPVVYFKWLYKDLKANKLVPKEEALLSGKLKPGYQKFPGLFYYNVFNYDQCSDLKIKFDKTSPKTAKQKIDSAEKIVDEMPKKPEIKKGSDEAFYSPSRDFVEMPPMTKFKVDQQYYGVLFHELIHSTGHTNRVGRDLTGKFGSKNYAFEELIAELGSSFLCGESGILYFTLKNSAAYIKNWSSALEKEMKADPRFFLRAASQAQKGADFILDIKEGAIIKVTSTQSSKDARPPVERKKVAASKTKKKPTVKVSKSDVENKSPKMPLPETKENNQVAAKPSKPSAKEFSGLGFIASDKAPEKPKDLFTLPGPIGSILGDLQRYKLEIVIAGETHSGKSEVGKQIADAFISIGDEVGYIDWEQGGLQSRDTLESIKRNVKPENRKKLLVSNTVPKSLEAVKSLAKKFKVIVLDSGSSLKQVTNAWIDELREEYPDTVWIILMQQNEKGGTRGGAAAEFDSPVVLKTYRPDESDYKKNYAYVYKNRGNPQTTGKYFLIADKRVVNDEPGKPLPK